MKTGFDEFSLTLGSRLLMLLTAIGVQSCLAWFLGPAGRGSFAVCLLFAVLLNVVFAVGCDAAAVYFVASKRFSISQGVVYSVLFAGISSALAITAGLILS